MRLVASMVGLCCDFVVLVDADCVEIRGWMLMVLLLFEFGLCIAGIYVLLL